MLYLIANDHHYDQIDLKSMRFVYILTLKMQMLGEKNDNLCNDTVEKKNIASYRNVWRWKNCEIWARIAANTKHLE